MKRFVKVCIVFIIIFGVIGVGCVGVAVYMGATPGKIFRVPYATKFRKAVTGKDAEKSYEFSADNVRNIDIELGSDDVEIVAGDDDMIHVENAGNTYRVDAELSDDTLEISSNYQWFFRKLFHFGKSGKTVVTIPKNMEVRDFDISCGSGNVDAQGLNITGNELNIEVGSGDVTLGSADFVDIDVESGSGDVELSLTGNKEHYTYDLECGSGDISIGDENYSKCDIERGNGYRTISVSSGSGDVDIQFNQQSTHHQSTNHYSQEHETEYHF